MCRRGHGTVFQISLAVLSSLISFCIGSLCIALVALYHQENAVLIVIACSSILYGFSSFPLTVFLRFAYSKLYFLLKMTCILLQLITLGASIEYFNHTTKYTIITDTPLHKRLLVTLDSLLICSFLVNGLILGYTRGVLDEPLKKNNVEEDLESNEPKPFMDNIQEKIEQFVPVKNSAQTLIPETDVLQNLQQIPSIPVMETGSMRSVIQHRVESMNIPRPIIPEDNTTGKIPRLKALMTNPKLKKPFAFKFTSPKAFTKNNGVNIGKRGNPMIWNRQKRNKRTSSSRHTGRLPTIPDLSRSILSCSMASQGLNSGHKFEKSADSIIDTFNFKDGNRHDSSIPAMELEKNAIERMNGALLPPCLQVSDPPITSPEIPTLNFGPEALSPVKSANSADNSIERNGLEDIPQVPQLPDETASGFFAEQDNIPHVDIPQTVTLENWEMNKEIFLQRAANMSKSKVNVKNDVNLLPALQFDTHKKVIVPELPETPDIHTKQNFCFPSQKPPEIQKSVEDNDPDTISELEQYFRVVGEEENSEAVDIEDGFQHHEQRFFKDIRQNNVKHSPTKSIASMISGKESLGGVQRSQTLLTSNNNNSTDGSPTRFSPSRSQRLKRMGKKLSLSNISDTMINGTGNPDNVGEFKSPFKDERKSVDFSYIYNLQSSHSPTKSISGLSSNHGSIYNNRRHSVATERSLGNTHSNVNTNTSVSFSPTIDTQDNSKLTEPIVECRTPPPNRIPSAESSEASAISTINYPDIVMSEHDRERWNTLLSLHLINSKGQFKATE